MEINRLNFMFLNSPPQKKKSLILAARVREKWGKGGNSNFEICWFTPQTTQYTDCLSLFKGWATWAYS